jgi:hypothetical protein
MSNLWTAVENVERIFGSASDGTSITTRLRQLRLSPRYGALSQAECYKQIRDMFGLKTTNEYSHTLLEANGERLYATLGDNTRVLELYTLFACGKQPSLLVEERTVSYASRLSLVVPKTMTTDFAELTTRVTECLFNPQSGVLVNRDNGGPGAPTGIVLETSDCWCYHFPTVMIYRHERRAILDSVAARCDFNVKFRDEEEATGVYNSAESPTYKCLTGPDFRYDLHLGPAGSFEVENSSLQTALPFLCSMNPLGSVLSVFRLRDTIDTPVSWWTVLEFPDPDITQSIAACTSLLGPEETWRRQLDAVTGLCQIVKRRLLVEDQRTVGQAIYAALNGTYFGFATWILFLQRCDVHVMQQWFALLQEWRQFGKVGTAINGTRYLHCLAQQDDSVAYNTFVDGQRREDHRERLSGSDTDLVSLMGSMTHVDLANFVCHELRHKVCCTVPAKGEWWVYKHSSHRWMPDNMGTSVMLLVYRVLQRSLQAARGETLEPSAESDDGSSERRTTKPRPSLAYMVNFPCSVDAERRQQACTLHLDSVCGDVRNIQNVMRAMHMLVYDSTFLSDLDVKNDHIIPFANGVLDIQSGVLRPGVPDDLVHRGPTYEWIDYNAQDAYVTRMEYILTTTFADFAVRQFVLDVFASLLRKRNRYKHFYILTGNTNGGKSFLLQILNSALGNLFCTIPVTAITARESDPSGHSEYLARTTGVSLCVCNEPDTSTQKLLPDKLKLFTSDSDRIPVRELYGQTREMPITWKLMMACNTPPALANCDAATVERTIFITFGSTFADERNVPVCQKEQFIQRLFPANKDYKSVDIHNLGRALMMILFTNYVRRNMHSQAFFLAVPKRLRLETDQYLYDMRQFKNFCYSFLRPSAIFNRSTSTSRELDWHVNTQGQSVLKEILIFEQKYGRRDEGSFDDEDRNKDIVGSPAWVHQECCRVLHLLHKRVTWANEPMQEGSFDLATIDIDTIVNAFMNFRSQNKPQHMLYNTSNQGNKSKSSVPTLEYSVRMKLDPGLVRQIIREVMNREPFQDLHLGVRLIASEDTPYSDMDQPCSQTVRRALLVLNTRWQARYETPIPHAGFLDMRDLRRTLDGLALGETGMVNSMWSSNTFEAAEIDWTPTSTEIHKTECPTTYGQCMELMRSHQFFSAAQLRTETDQHKISCFEPGFSKVGTVRADVTTEEPKANEKVTIFQPAVPTSAISASPFFQYE